MGTVSVPAEFFRQELRMYSNWREAFVREVLQNSVDAGATRIDVSFARTSAGGAQVTFADNGHGMTRRTLEDVFFALGRSTKIGEDTIGGFGRARIIICFAQRQYTVRTSDVLVTGAGGQYSVAQVSQSVAGCTFTIDLVDDDTDLLRTQLERFVLSCTMPTAVHLDGQPLAQMERPARAARILRDDDGRAWGRAYVVPDRVGVLRVQVRGLTMFSRYIPGSDDVVVDMVPSRARALLVASRDQLVSPYSQQLDQFVDDLTNDRRSALREPSTRLDLRVHGGGFLATVRAPQDHHAPSGSLAGAPQPVPGTAAQGTVLVRPASPRSAGFAAVAARLPHGAEGTAHTDVRSSSAIAPGLECDVFLFADVTNAQVRRWARTWNPVNWSASTARRQRRLLRAWKTAVAYALDVLVELHPQAGDVLWTVGWVFDDDVSAQHRTVTPGHVLVLNPLRDGKLAYHLGDRADRRRLLAVAAHEACHVLHPDHREDFAALLTDLVGRMDQAQGDRLIRAAIAGL